VRWPPEAPPHRKTKLVNFNNFLYENDYLLLLHSNLKVSLRNTYANWLDLSKNFHTKSQQHREIERKCCYLWIERTGILAWFATCSFSFTSRWFSFFSPFLRSRTQTLSLWLFLDNLCGSLDKLCGGDLNGTGFLLRTPIWIVVVQVEFVTSYSDFGSVLLWIDDCCGGCIVLLWWFWVVAGSVTVVLSCYRFSYGGACWSSWWTSSKFFWFLAFDSF
jgi:hypothetical protein